jgi:hypothetical protein
LGSFRPKIGSGMAFSTSKAIFQRHIRPDRPPQVPCEPKPAAKPKRSPCPVRQITVNAHAAKSRQKCVLAVPVLSAFIGIDRRPNKVFAGSPQ